MLRLAFPVVSVQLGLMLMGVVDTLMVARLSGDALAGVALATIFAWSLMVVGIGILHALDPLVSQAHGARDEEALGSAIRGGAVLALLLSLPYLVAFQSVAPFLRLLGQPPAAVEIADDFTRVLAPGVPALFLFMVVRQSLQGMGLVRPVLVAVLVGNVANLVGNFLLIHGHLGFPALGVNGCAWSTTCSRWLMFALAAWGGAPVLRRHLQRAAGKRLTPGSPLRLLRMGLPIGVQMALESWVFTVAGMWIGAMGTLSLAAHQIALNFANLALMIPIGLGAAAATRVGNAIGRADGEATRLTARVAFGVMGATMLVLAILLGVFSSFFARLYTAETGLVLAAAHLLRIAALFLLFHGAQTVGCGILRGAAETQAPAVISLISHWTLGLPLGIGLASWGGLGAPGLWWGLTFGLAIASALVLRRVLDVTRMTGPSPF